MAKKIDPNDDKKAMNDLIGFGGSGRAARALYAEEMAVAPAPASAPAEAPTPRKAPVGKTLNVKLPGQVHSALKMASAKEQLTYVELIEKLLRDSYPELF